MNLIQKLAQNKIKNLIFYAFLGIYFTLLLYVGYKLNIWEDEAYSLNTTSLGFRQVIHQSYHFEGQPPFYFLSLALWRLINPGIFFARLFSVLFIGLTAIILYRFIHLFPEIKNPKWIIAIFLLHPFTVWAATEIRTYALIIFLSAVSIYFYVRYDFEKRKRYLYYFLIVSLIGLYTQYLFVFLLTAIAITLLIFNGWKVFFRFCLYLIPVIILILPNFYFLSDNIKNIKSVYSEYSIGQRFSLLHSSIQSIVLPIDLLAKQTSINRALRIFVLLLFSYSYFRLYRQQKQMQNWAQLGFKKYNVLLIFTFFFIVPLSLFFIFSGIRLNTRYLALTFPVVILLFTIFTENNFLIRNLFYAFIAVYFSVSLIYQYKVPVKTYDYSSFARYIEKIERPDEPILMNSRTISTPFEYYYQKRNHLVQLPDSFKFTKEGFQVIIKDTNELKLVLNQTKSKSILFVNDNMLGYNSKLKLNANILDTYLKSNYQIVLDTLYSGRGKGSLRIRRLIKSKTKSTSNTR